MGANNISNAEKEANREEFLALWRKNNNVVLVDKERVVDKKKKVRGR